MDGSGNERRKSAPHPHFIRKSAPHPYSFCNERELAQVGGDTHPDPFQEVFPKLPPARSTDISIHTENTSPTVAWLARSQKRVWCDPHLRYPRIGAKNAVRTQKRRDLSPGPEYSDLV